MIEIECRGERCRAKVVWVQTERGSKMLVNADSWGGETFFVRGKHTPHWATCPDAERFRKKRRKTRNNRGPRGRERS